MARAAASSNMKQRGGSSKEASGSNGASLGIDLDNDADPEATVITVSGQGHNNDLLSQMTGWHPACMLKRAWCQAGGWRAIPVMELPSIQVMCPLMAQTWVDAEAGKAGGDPNAAQK